MLIILDRLFPMASSHEMLSVLEECRVSPPPSSVGEKSLPLTFSDMVWIHFYPVRSLFFYKFPHSKTHFIDTTIPSLKHSLSLALKHYYPFAGNLVFPPNLAEPEIHYQDGDSVSLTFAESDTHFDYLIKPHQREVAAFHPLVPQLPPVWVRHDSLVAPISAFQVTLFPNSGISFGFTINHVLADGNAFFRFMKLWGTIHKAQIKPLMLESAILPFYDRSTIVEQTKELNSIYWNHQQKIKFEGCPPLLPTSNILATFVLSEADLQRLKERVMVQCPTLSHVSSFAVTCAYTWVCIVKSREWSGEEMNENESEHLAFMADCRAHMDPPLPENYFGNCVVPCSATAKHVELVDKDGVVIAANLIGEAIRERLGSNKGVLQGLEKSFLIRSSMKTERKVGVAGSPRFAAYGIDFGLGRLQKCEFISIDETRAISLHEGKYNRRDIEVGLSLPKIQMDAFASIFTNDLMVDK